MKRLALTAAALAFLFARAGADDNLPFVVAAGVGPVYDAENDWGWSLRLAGLGHPWSKPWFQAGMEVSIFGRPERLESDETTSDVDGSRRVREWKSDAGSAVGAAFHFPFGFGPPERKPVNAADLRAPTRRLCEVAPTASGGLFLDSTTTSRRIDTEGANPSIVRKGDEGRTHLAGGYAQFGGRARWSFLELATGVEAASGHPVQFGAWLGFNVPW